MTMELTVTWFLRKPRLTFLSVNKALTGDWAEQDAVLGADYHIHIRIPRCLFRTRGSNRKVYCDLPIGQERRSTVGSRVYAGGKAHWLFQ